MFKFIVVVVLGAGAPGAYVIAQDKIFEHGFESPIMLRVATFNTRFSFNGSIVDGNYLADPVNVSTTINKFNELKLDVAGLQEVHDYAALETLAEGTGLNLAAAKTDVHFVFPPAILSSLPVVSRATYNNGGGPVVETGVRLPDGTIAYVFSIHVHWQVWKKVHAAIISEIIRRRSGSHPVIVVGDMNGNTARMLENSRGALNVVYDVNIDAIMASEHFQLEGAGENHGNLGFSDHPLLVADLTYTPGSNAQASVPSISHLMAPETSWNVGQALAPDPSVLAGITIRRLPQKATLKLGDTPLEVDETIPAGRLHELVYTAVPGSIGKDHWTFDIAEPAAPAVNAPRWVDVFIQDKISNLRNARYTRVDPDMTHGWSYLDLAYANVGEFIYPHDDGSHTNFDTFNDNLPDELKGELFILNGGRNDIGWENDYIRFDLPQPTRVYVALGHRVNGHPRDIPGWTKQWDSVAFNDGTGLPYDIFTQCLDTGEVLIWGNEQLNPNSILSEENLVVFIGGNCENPEPGCDITGIDGYLGHWADEARDCQRSDCSDGQWHAWDGKQYCRSMAFGDSEEMTIRANYGINTFSFWADWAAGDGNDCGDGRAAISIPACGLEIEVVRGAEQQRYHCYYSSRDTLTLFRDGGDCDYVVLGDPGFFQ